MPMTQVFRILKPYCGLLPGERLDTGAFWDPLGMLLCQHCLLLLFT